MNIEPKKPKERTSWRNIARELRKTPGEWHLIGTDANTGIASHLRRTHGLEVRMEGVDGKTKRASKLFARYPEQIVDIDAPNPIARRKTHQLIAQLKHHVDRNPQEARVISAALVPFLEEQS